MARRMYVIDVGDTIAYCTATSRAEATAILGKIARIADPDDLRAIWELAKLNTMSFEEIEAKFGVGRQTVTNWRKRAGGDLPRRRDFVNQSRLDRIKDAIRKHRKATPSQLAELAGSSTAAIRQVASEMGVKLAQGRRRPSDEELVELAKGKTWREFAAAVGMQLATLRAYVYKRPELAQQIRAVRKAQTKGALSQKKITPQKVRALHKKGLSAYAISQRLGVEQMAIRYWFRKLALGGSNEAATRDGRKAGATVGGSDGGAPVQS